MVSKKTVEQAIMDESIRRVEEKVKEEIETGRTIVPTDAPDFIKSIVESASPLTLALAKIVVLSRLN